MKKHAAPIIVAVLLLLPVLYIGSYLALVNLAVVFFTGRGQNMSLVIPNYRFGGAIARRALWPLEQVDRRMRPGA